MKDMKDIKKYEFRDLYAESINQSTVEHSSGLSEYCSPTSLINIKEDFLNPTIDTGLQRRALDDWQFKKLPTSGFYLFDNVDMFGVDKAAKYQLVKNYCQFRQSHKYSVPTKDSLEKAETLLKNKRNNPNSDYGVSVSEAMALNALEHLDSYKNLCKEALNEYFITLKHDESLANFGLTKETVFLDHCLRFPEKITAIKKMGLLRLKTRRRLKVDSKAWVGF